MRQLMKTMYSKVCGWPHIEGGRSARARQLNSNSTPFTPPLDTILPSDRPIFSSTAEPFLLKRFKHINHHSMNVFVEL